MKSIELRLARLESDRREPTTNYVVRLPVEAMDDEETVHAAIAEHRKRTGYAGAVVLASFKLTKDEWVARFGRTADGQLVSAASGARPEAGKRRHRDASQAFCRSRCPGFV